MDAPEYEIYPAGLTEPYRTNRFTIGEQMYATLGIAREDKEGRRRQFAHNNDFFGAPAALFCYVDRQMGLPQWSDLGMFLQTFMLLAVEAGLATCAQEYWSVRHQAVTSFVGAPENEMLFCGMAIGHADESAPINSLVSERMPLDDWARFM
jgi:nitroreductase